MSITLSWKLVGSFCSDLCCFVTKSSPRFCRCTVALNPAFSVAPIESPRQTAAVRHMADYSRTRMRLTGVDVCESQIAVGRSTHTDTHTRTHTHHTGMDTLAVNNRENSTTWLSPSLSHFPLSSLVVLPVTHTHTHAHTRTVASTPYKRWSKCTMKKIGGKVFAGT